MSRKSWKLGLAAAAVIILAAIAGEMKTIAGGKSMDSEFKDFLSEYEARVVPLAKSQSLASFHASISGQKQDFDQSADLQIQLSKIYANREEFSRLKAIRKSGEVTDPLLKRELEIITNAYLANQIDEKKLAALILLQTQIENKFYTFRPEVDGRKLSDNEIEETLKNSTDSKALRVAWMASKEIGPVVAEDIRTLARMRNEMARQLGFPDYHQMSLTLSEQKPREIERLFDELDRLTRDAFAKAKAEIDASLAARYGIPAKDLQPWHYQNRFFQEAPKIYNLDLDRYYRDRDVVQLTRTFYAGIGLPVDELIDRSDLYEREGKYQHAYCTHIDRLGDVRVVGNVKPNADWMGTMLHEFGHAVYDRYLDMKLPWTLREPAHAFTTEAIAMLFGRCSTDPRWMQAMLGLPEDETARVATETGRILRLQQLVFSRWAQVMYRFEQNMYRDPDQDLNKLWWDLVEKYQLLRRPEGGSGADWASKIHIATVPAYYHNYLMGELLASQLTAAIVRDVLKEPAGSPLNLAGRPEVGRFLRDRVFQPGRLYPWNQMIQQATGEKLTPKYFARQFVK